MKNLEWKDTTTYRKDDTERIPTAFTLFGRTGLRITITCNHRLYPDEWVMHCDALGINTKQLWVQGIDKLEEAKQVALTRVHDVVSRLQDEWPLPDHIKPEPLGLQTEDSIIEIIKRISYKDWVLKLGDDGDRFYLQWCFQATDVNTGEEESWKSRKWMISRHMVNSEIINTAYLAAKVAETHEFMENFKLNDKILYNPHVDVEYLNSLDLPESIRD